MIQKLQKLSHLLKNSQQTPATYNASLPILIRVIQKLKGDMYLLQIGAQQMQTKSHKALIVGERYWGEMGRSSLGHITLHNLILQPKILDFFQILCQVFRFQLSAVWLYRLQGCPKTL